MPLASNAWAATDDCDTGEAPSPFDSADCDANNYGNVCQTRWVSVPPGGYLLFDCYVDRDQGNDCGEMTAVTDYDGSSSTLVSVWGKTSQGTNFCCTEDRALGGVELNGTNETDCGDVLKFNYSDGTKNLTANSGTPLTHAQIDGRDGYDEIHGSYEDAGNYSETLNGDGGDDTIVCNDGDDTADGGDGDDEINGDGDDDTLTGGDDEDLLCGGSGTDWMDGEADDDILDGGGQVGDYKFGGGTTSPPTPYGNECDDVGTNHATCTTIGIESSYTCP